MLQSYYDFLDKYLERVDFQMCEMDTDSAYIAITGDSSESLVNSNKINVTGSQEPTLPNMRPMIREVQVFLKLNGKGKESWDCVPKPIIVLRPKINLVVNKKCNEINKEKYLNVLCYSPNKIVAG